VDVGGEPVDAVAEGEFDTPEELLVGQVEQLAGQVEGGLLDQGEQALLEGLQACLSLRGVRGGGDGGVRQQGCSPAVTTRVGGEVPATTRS
jgi:hypothetical protein